MSEVKKALAKFLEDKKQAGNLPFSDEELRTIKAKQFDGVLLIRFMNFLAENIDQMPSELAESLKPHMTLVSSLQENPEMTAAFINSGSLDALIAARKEAKGSSELLDQASTMEKILQGVKDGTIPEAEATEFALARLSQPLSPSRASYLLDLVAAGKRDPNEPDGTGFSRGEKLN